MKRLMICMSLALALSVSLISCRQEMKITGQRLIGKSDVNLGKPFSSSNLQISGIYDPAMSQRGDEILFSMPVIKEGKGTVSGEILTSKSYKIKGDIYRLFNLNAGNKNLIWITSKANSRFHLYCFKLTHFPFGESCRLDKLFEVETATPRIVSAYGRFGNEYSKLSSDDDFIICQSTDFSKIAYYDLEGKIINEYSIGNIALSYTNSEYQKLYGFDGKNIYTMSPIMTSNTKIFTTSTRNTGLNLDLESTDFCFYSDLFFVNNSKLYIVNTNSMKTDKSITPAVFNDIDKYDLPNRYVTKADGIYELVFDEKKLEFELNQVYKSKSNCKYYFGVYPSHNLQIYVKITENIDNKFRFVIISKDKNGLYRRSYSDFLETDKMPFWFDIGYYYDAFYYNSDGVWLTNSSDVVRQQMQ